MNEDSKKLIEVVLRICSGLCAYPDKLKIKPIKTMHSLTISVTPNELDYPKLIGAKGKVFQAMELILTKACENIWITDGTPKQLRASLEIVKIGEGHEFIKVPMNPNYDINKLLKLVNDTCALVLKNFRVAKVDVGREKSVIEVYPDPNEGIDKQLADALNTIFYAYGRATGRIIELECAHVQCETEA